MWHPCRSPNSSGQQHFGDIRLTLVCTDDGMFSLLLLLAKFGPICGIHRFPLGKLTLLVGVGLTFAPKARVICCQHVQPVCAWNDFVANMSVLAAHGTLLQMLCFLE